MFQTRGPFQFSFFIISNIVKIKVQYLIIDIHLISDFVSCIIVYCVSTLLYSIATWTNVFVEIRQNTNRIQCKVLLQILHLLVVSASFHFYQVCTEKNKEKDNSEKVSEF